jgi:hypothetical protein
VTYHSFRSQPRRVEGPPGCSLEEAAENGVKWWRRLHLLTSVAAMTPKQATKRSDVKVAKGFFILALVSKD